MVREITIEKTLCDTAKTFGGVALKLAIEGKNNFPDRTIMLPFNYIVFAECKAPKKDLRKSQRWFANNVLTPLSCKLYLVRCQEDVDLIFSDYKAFLSKVNSNVNTLETRPTSKILLRRRRKKITRPIA